VPHRLAAERGAAAETDRKGREDGEVRVALVDEAQIAGADAHLGFGRTVASEIEVRILLVNLVASG
jgi:hypothetical protein